MKTLVEIALLYVVTFGGIGFALGQSKGLSVDGVVYGILLGPLGWLIVLLKSPVAKRARQTDQGK